ncbi:hypothetical protein ACIBJI_13840 [Nocardia sp. NPDC050408]|uniref:hypothetical protein n=1 Tax=Nocardia sp. NPDC050408 TaxID=3364319 RepID=UPI00378CB5FC
MQRPTSPSRDRWLKLVDVQELTHTRVSHQISQAHGLPGVREILAAVLGAQSTAAAREQHTIARWAGELAHICLQGHNEHSGDRRVRAVRIIRIIDFWIEVYVRQDGDVQVEPGETIGTVISRIAEVGAELYSVKDSRIPVNPAVAILERKLDRLAEQYTDRATALAAAGR